jgi:hypothetical protein
MFDHVVLRRAESGAPVTAGTVAEALLFYQKVHLILDRQTLFELVRQIGPSGLLSLIARPDFSAVYTDEMLGTMTNSVGASKCHDFVAFTLSGKKSGPPFKSSTERLQNEFELAGLSAAQAKKIAVAVLKRVPVRKMSGNHFVEGGIPDAARGDLDDTDYLGAAFAEIVRQLPGGYDCGSSIRVEVIKGQTGYFVFDSIDYERVNQRRAQMNPAGAPMTTADILSHVQDARADLALAAHYGGDFVTSTITSSVIRLKLDMLLRRTELNAKARQDFTEVVLPDVPTISEQVDSGARSFHEFLVLLDKSAKFREWLKTTNPDEGLTREYLRAITSQDWIQTTRSKGIRYLLTLGADATHPLAGLAAGLVDNFLIDKLLGGWRPNHFIDERLAPFLACGGNQR